MVFCKKKNLNNTVQFVHLLYFFDFLQCFNDFSRTLKDPLTYTIRIANYAEFSPGIPWNTETTIYDQCASFGKLNVEKNQ